MSEFDKVIGYEEIKNELMLYCDVLKYPQKYKELGVKTPSGILLVGSPGLGKTLMAKCFIAESGCKTFTLRKEKPNGDFVKEIKEVYEKAKTENGAIVFLDDLDKFANGDYDHPNAEEYVTVQSCIDECKAFGVFTISTVNDRKYLPDSLLRSGRFDKIINVQEPNGDNFHKIIEYYMAEKSVSENIDIEEIERLMEHNSCANLETIINDAGIYAGFAGKQVIEQEDLVKACIRSLFGAPESDDVFGEDLRRAIAVHEAGHAVVAEIIYPGSVNAISIKRCSSDTGGLTLYKELNGERCIFSDSEFVIMRSLAGKAANDVVFGIADAGCSQDMSDAYSGAAMLVEECCAYSFDSYIRYHDSDYLLENGDRRISAVIERLYAEAKNIIMENRNFLDTIVMGLLEKDTLTFRDIQRIRQKLGQKLRSNEKLTSSFG